MKTYEEITMAEVTKFCKSASLERLDLAHDRICRDIEESVRQIEASKFYIMSCQDTGEDPTKELEWYDWLSEIKMKQLDCLREVAKYIQFKHDGYWKQCEPDWAIIARHNYRDDDDPDADYWDGQYEAMMYKRAWNNGIHIRRQYATA